MRGAVDDLREGVPSGRRRDIYYLLIEQLCDHQRHLPPALTHSDLFVCSVPRPIEGLVEGLADVPRSPDTPLEDAPPEVEGVDPVVPAPVVDPSLGEVPVPTPVPGIPPFPVAPLPGAPALPDAPVPAAPPTPLLLPDPAVPLPLPVPPPLPAAPPLPADPEPPPAPAAPLPPAPPAPAPPPAWAAASAGARPIATIIAAGSSFFM